MAELKKLVAGRAEVVSFLITILAAWDQAMTILELDIPREAYQTTLAPTYPKQWISPGILTVAAPTPYIRDWLTDRLTSTLSRLLCGILAQPVSHIFILNGLLQILDQGGKRILTIIRNKIQYQY